MVLLAKRRRALLESNPPRNSQWRLIETMGCGGHAKALAPRFF